MLADYLLRVVKLEKGINWWRLEGELGERRCFVGLWLVATLAMARRRVGAGCAFVGPTAREKYSGLNGEDGLTE